MAGNVKENVERLVQRITAKELTGDDWPGIMDLQDEILAYPALLNPVFDTLMTRLSQNQKSPQVILRTLTVISSLQCNGIPGIETKISARPYLDLVQAILGQALRQSDFSICQIVQQHLESLGTEDAGRNPYLNSRLEEMQRLGMLRGGAGAGNMTSTLPRQPPKPINNTFLIQQSDVNVNQEQKRKEQELKEKEEMELAIALSLSEAEASKSSSPSRRPSSRQYPNPALQASNSNVDAIIPSIAPVTTSGSKFKFVVAMYDFTGDEAGELSFTKNQIISVLDSSHPDWWKGELSGRQGIFPSNYVKVMEANVPASVKLGSNSMQSSKSGIDASMLSDQINRLHALLLAQSKNPKSGLVENHELQDLYHKVLISRPKVARDLADVKKKLARNSQVSGKLDAALKKYEYWEKTMLSQPSPMAPFPGNSELNPTSSLYINNQSYQQQQQPPFIQPPQLQQQHTQQQQQFYPPPNGQYYQQPPQQ